MLDFSAVELALVFQQVELLRPGNRIDDLNLLSLVQENAVHAHVGIDCDNVVIDEKSLPNSTLVFVSINDVLEVGHCVRGGGCGQTDLVAIKVIESFPPNRTFLSRISSVALIGDDEIKC